MKEICLTYYDTDVGLSTYLKLYFRMIGVFVYERILRDEKDRIRYSKRNLNLDVDAEILIWNSEFFDIDLRADIHESCYLLYNDWEEEIEEKFSDVAWLVGYEDGESFLDVLKRLIRRLGEEFSTPEFEPKILIKLAKIYNDNHILEAIMGTRYSILDEEIFEECHNFYLDAFDQITRYIDTDTYDKYEEDFYAIFAMLYLAFEDNYACKKLDEVFYFDIKEIKEVVEDILEEEDYKDWLSLEILYAQIYDELLEKKEKAKVLYDATLNKKQTGFAWYKLGLIFEERDRNYPAAYSCMMNALEINPMSYKALRHAGNCNLSMERTAMAYQQYNLLLDLLEGKRIASSMRIIEAEYYYKTYVLLGSQAEIRNGNIYRAKRLYKNAFQFWIQCREDQGKPLAEAFRCDHHFIKHLYNKWLQSINVEELYERLEQLDALTTEN